MNKAIVWFRNDLRVLDNAALYEASQKNIVIAIYIEAIEQRKLHHDSPAKIGFTIDSLLALKKQLKEYNIPLNILQVSTYNDIPNELIKLAKENFQAESIYYNKEYLFNELKRDRQVENLALKNNIEIHSFDSDLILSPNCVRKPNGEAYRVFTPYKKSWIQQYKLTRPKSYPAPKKQDTIGYSNQLLCHLPSQEYRRELWPAGEVAAQQRLEKFIHKVATYKTQRDIPSIPGTSLLSPYLTVGSISALQCVERLYDYYFANDELFYQDTWLSELIWRDFYRQIIIDMPSLAMHKPFKVNASEPWEDRHDLFSAWCKGETGFPIVDAAMRQLNQTGWMHNRLRMISAMFLSKLCRVDWRWGEKYFMKNLIDGDFASNNGGWQWCSSTGADSAPYFRIMNPTTQSKRFDENGNFIKLFLPELAGLDNKSIHQPTKKQCDESNYPTPIINYKESRQRTIELFK